jgi:hypothetical protein
MKRIISLLISVILLANLLGSALMATLKTMKPLKKLANRNRTFNNSEKYLGITFDMESDSHLSNNLPQHPMPTGAAVAFLLGGGSKPPPYNMVVRRKSFRASSATNSAPMPPG